MKNKTKIILFASLITAIILPFSMMDMAFAESRDDKINRLGNEGKELKEKIDIEKHSDKKEEFKDDLKELKSQMRAIGIPTVEEYEADKEYWREIAVQHHLDELDRIEESLKKEKLKKISYTKVACSSCGNNDNKVAKFQTAYGYDCYAGLWTCHAYAPSWIHLFDGQGNSQTLYVENEHNWIDPFWLVGSNARMNITYTYLHTNYDDGHRQIYNSEPQGDVQSISNSRDVDTVYDSPRVDNPRANYSVDTFWYINSIR